MNPIAVIPVLMLLAGLSACAAKAPDVTGSESQVQIREIQTREYDALDKRMTMRSVISTLQDLGFVIGEADLDLGTVTATRHHQYAMRMTVTVRERDGQRIAVRANARIGEEGITDPRTYQDFFAALDKAIFLTANRID